MEVRVCFVLQFQRRECVIVTQSERERVSYHSEEDRNMMLSWQSGSTKFILYPNPRIIEKEHEVGVYYTTQS